MYTEPARKVSFVLDTRMNGGLAKFAKGADVLVSEATHSVEAQDVASDHGHLSSVDAANIAKKAKTKKLILIHLSQRYDEIPKVILSEAKKVFRDVSVVEDLDKLEL